MHLIQNSQQKMVRKQEMRGVGGGDHTLSVKVPSLFRCPISLDVMKSPVSLCTGVTYDRSSIQRWLESGNNTCPATMQPLPSTDLVPNLTLQRLINLWAQSGPLKLHPARALLAEIRSSADPAPSLRKLSAFFDDKDADEFEKNQLINANGCAEILSSIISNNLGRLEILEEAVRVVSRILASECIEKDNKQITIAAVSSRNLDGSVSSLIRVLKEGRSMETRANAAAIVDSVLTNVSDSKILLAENKDLIPELIRLVGEEEDEEEKRPDDSIAIDAGLSCLVQLSGVRRVRGRMVQLRMVPILTRILSEDATVLPAETAEKAMKLMEAASGCSEGREAICEAADAAIPAILRWTRKCGKEGTEAAVVVLWSLCHLFRDRRAQEAVEANGGLTKILVMMQSGCSPAARQMAGDLLKIFRVNAKTKCCLAGYDTKTTHIMPF